MSSNFNIDDFLKQSMDEFEFQPRINSFDAVMDKLAKKKRRRIMFILFIGISLLGTLAFLFSTDKTNLLVAKSTKEAQARTKQTAYEKTALINQSKADVKDKRNLKRLKSAVPAKSDFGKPTINRNSAQNPAAPLNITAVDNHIAQAATLNNTIIAASSAQPPATYTPALDYVAISSPETNSDSSTTAKSAIAAHSLTNATAVISKIELSADSQIANKKNRRFMIGINANPQYSSLLLRENKNRNPWYDTANSATYAETYLKSRKENNRFNFNYSLGIKLGYQLNDKWEVWVNGGFQHVMYYEDFFTTYQGNTLTGSGFTSAGLTNTAKQTEKGYKNEFYYRTFGFNFSKTIEPNPFLKLKFDFGLCANNLFISRTSFIALPNSYFADFKSIEAQTSKWIYSANLRFGIAKELTDRIQYRISPGLFFAPASMFKREYIIKQNNYGAEVEAALIFKMF